MEIIIHQLICGENDKREWGLLKTTLVDKQLSNKLAFKSDFQDYSGGITWESAVRGFTYEGYFLLIKTFPDKSPTVRQGRKFSHVLLINNNDIDKLSNIDLLFSYLFDEIDKTRIIEPISLNAIPKDEQEYSIEFKERFNKVFSVILDPNEFGRTIIWVGEEDYLFAVSYLWKTISSEERIGFNFGVNFNIDAIPKGDINLVNVPESAESKFLHQGFCISKKYDKYILKNLGEKILARDYESIERVKVFRNAIEAESFSKEQMENISIILNTFEDITSIKDFKKINTLSHVVANLSSNPQKGVSFKTILLRKISTIIDSNDDLSTIIILRNFKVSSFNNSEEILSSAIDKWFNKFFFSKTMSKKYDVFSLFMQLKSSNNHNWWERTIIQSIQNFIGTPKSNVVSTIIDWTKSNFEIFRYVEDWIDKSDKTQELFIDKFSLKLEEFDFQEMKNFCIKRKWYKFFSIILKLTYGFEEAIKELLRVDTDLSYIEGINVIIQGVKSEKVIDFTILSGDSRLVSISGNLCNNTPNLLEKIDFKNEYWQEIWKIAVLMGNQITEGFKKPLNKIYELFDTIIEGNIVNEDLLYNISNSDYANIIDYPQRNILWDKFSVDLRNEFLRKTSAVLLESLSINSTVRIPTDTTLSDYILKDAISDFLYFNYNKIKNVIPIFNKFEKISESNVRDYVRNYGGAIDIFDANQLGKLVYRRKYKSVAYALRDKVDYGINWKYSIIECQSLLDFSTRAYLALWCNLPDKINITSDEWWNGAEEIIIELFSNWNSLKTIWKKSGGKESDLMANGTTREIWEDLLKRIRYGKFKKKTMSKLLSEIKKSYEDNAKFNMIFDLRKYYIETD